MGGLVAARFATARVRPVRALVLSSPALGLRISGAMMGGHRALLALAPRLRVPNPIDTRYLSHDAAAVARYRADPLVQRTITAGVLDSMLTGIAQAQADAPLLEAPSLVMVAGADRIIDPAGAKRFCDQAPADLCEMAWFGDAYHELFNEAEPLRSEVFGALTQWLRRHLQPVTGPT
jgi:lysophospholipase